MDIATNLANALLKKGIDKGANIIGDAICEYFETNSVEFEDYVSDTLNKIETKLDAIINAPIIEAKRYYKLGEINTYKEKLIQAISMNQLNLVPRLLYIKLMLELKRYDIILEEYWDIVDYLGIRTDIVPQEIINAYIVASKNSISIPNDSFTCCFSSGDFYNDSISIKTSAYVAANGQLTQVWVCDNIVVSQWCNPSLVLVVNSANNEVLLRSEYSELLMLTKKLITIRCEKGLLFTSNHILIYDIPNISKIYERKYKRAQDWAADLKYNELFGNNREIPFAIYDEYHPFPENNGYIIENNRRIVFSQYWVDTYEINDKAIISVGRSEDHFHYGTVSVSKSITDSCTMYDTFFKITKK